MNDTMSLVLATTILATGGLCLYMYKSSNEDDPTGDENYYAEDNNEDNSFSFANFFNTDDEDKNVVYKKTKITIAIKHQQNTGRPYTLSLRLIIILI